MVPGSTFRYGSIFCIITEYPRAFSRCPKDAAVIPLPRDETTPPVTKMYFVMDRHAFPGRVRVGMRACRRSGRGRTVRTKGRSLKAGEMPASRRAAPLLDGGVAGQELINAASRLAGVGHGADHQGGAGGHVARLEQVGQRVQVQPRGGVGLRAGEP